MLLSHAGWQTFWRGCLGECGVFTSNLVGFGLLLSAACIGGIEKAQVTVGVSCNVLLFGCSCSQSENSENAEQAAKEFNSSHATF
jgi:hypothetical protein